MKLFISVHYYTHIKFWFLPKFFQVPERRLLAISICTESELVYSSVSKSVKEKHLIKNNRLDLLKYLAYDKKESVGFIISNVRFLFSSHHYGGLVFFEKKDQFLNNYGFLKKYFGLEFSGNTGRLIEEEITCIANAIPDHLFEHAQVNSTVLFSDEQDGKYTEHQRLTMLYTHQLYPDNKADYGLDEALWLKKVSDFIDIVKAQIKTK